MGESTRGSRVEPTILEYTVGDEETISDAVLRAVAAVSNAEPTDLPPLYHAISPDDLNIVFRSDRARGRVRFRYGGYVVDVDAEGTVAVSHPNGTADRS
jgi:hypothetical protein